MSYSRVPDAEIEAGEFVLSTTAKQFRDNQDFFAGQLGTLSLDQVSNGSFEIASDAAQPNLPDNWTLTRYPNGVFVLDTTNPRHGANIAKFTHPSGSGSGGGELLSDFIEMGPDRGYAVEWTHWATNATVHVTMQINYYTDAQVFISTQTLFDASSGIVSAATRYAEYLAVPATARYMRVEFIGGDPDTDPTVSTDIYLDDVKMVALMSYAAGDTVLVGPLGASAGAGGGLQKVLENPVYRGGTLRFAYGFSDIGGSDTGQVYRNGSPVGILRTATASYSEDITGWQPGDLAQFYINDLSGGASAVSSYEIKASTTTNY